MFHSAADSKFSLSLQLSRAEFVSLLLEAFSAFPCSSFLKLRNYALFKSASHCLFLPRNQQKILFFLHINILTATHRVELSPSIHLTTPNLQWKRTNSLNVTLALQLIFTSSFPQPRGYRLFNRVFPTTLFS